ncbi:MAG: hypothetical protein HY722_14565 [Planctomycetes bacterium]|nr:hypothetical protein [Planctomycetota bacterium]
MSAAGRVTIDEFSRFEIRTARVVDCRVHPDADRLLILDCDLGEGERRQIVAGIRRSYAPEALVGRTIVIVANLEPAVLRGVESQGMLLAASPPDRATVAVLTVDGDVPAGWKVT